LTEHEPWHNAERLYQEVSAVRQDGTMLQDIAQVLCDVRYLEGEEGGGGRRMEEE
jgi:hypothetical protein